jgi:hypothetical protein
VETRLVPDAPGAWLVYDLGTLVLAVPPEFRAAADAVAAKPPVGVTAVLAALRASGTVDSAPFAVLEATAGGIHLALRGPATLVVGAQTLTGLGAEPWLETVVPRADVVRLTVPGGEWTLTLPPATPVQPLPPVPPLPSVPPMPPIVDSPLHITEIPELSLPSAPTPPPALGLGLGFDEHGGVTAPAAPTPTPTLSLELPDGSREPLDTVVLVGRAPSVPAGAPASRLVRLEGDSDISRTHARVAVEGGTVLVTDLGSRNGTIVRIPGRPAQRLREGEPTPVLVGTVIDLGGGLELNVRDD